MNVASSGDAGLVARIRATLRDVPDFPRPGILFRDITPLLGDATLFVEATSAMAAPFAGRGITHVAGIEARGFIFAAPIAQVLGAGFIPVRKPGKLPARTLRRAYGLEYGADALEVHVDACPPDSHILVVDDVLATGGTAEAAVALLEEAGGVVAGVSFLLAIEALGGAARLARYDILRVVAL